MCEEVPLFNAPFVKQESCLSKGLFILVILGATIHTVVLYSILQDDPQGCIFSKQCREKGQGRGRVHKFYGFPGGV